MKNIIIRVCAILIILTIILPIVPAVTASAAASPVQISATGVTTVALADVCDSFVGNLFIENAYGTPYFDGVRPNDTLTMKIQVDQAATYQWCMVTGWASPHVCGDFTLILDGEEISTIQNKVAGVDWRTWLDTTIGKVNLPAGEHKLTVRFASAGPNVYGMKFAPEGVDMKDQGGTLKLCGPSDTTPIQIADTYAVQFHLTVPFDSISVRCPSWSNNQGSLRFDLYKWNESYGETVSGSVLASEEFVDYADNATLQLAFDSPMEKGEYILLITNTSADPNEQVGVWATEPVEHIRNYIGGVEGANAASVSVHYIGATESPIGSLSANLQETPSYEEITELPKDLTQYHLPATSRYPSATVQPDTWVFTDGLGRVSLTNSDVGDPRENKDVAMFFWNWHATFANAREPFNVQQYIDKQTAAGVKLEDYLYDYDYAGWGTKTTTAIQYFWDEPIYGYYRSDDIWVVRRQAELLTAAGIDVIFTDNTNATLTWGDAYPIIYKTFTEAQADGVNTPKISNYLPFAPGTDTAVQLREYYTNIYHDGNYRSLWYYLEGKPMIAAHSSSLGTSALDSQISEFFTFRAGQPDYFVKRTSLGQWGWLSTAEQAKYYKDQADRRAGMIEQMTVGVAMNADYTQNALAAMSGHNIMGRSYTSDYQDRYVKEGAEASKWGYNFAEQWENALKADPKIVFVTGWNEWNASRYASWPANSATAVENAFPDTFCDEFSRDIEPSRGALADHYYYQLVNYVRQYKGVNPIPQASAAATIDMTAGYDQWQSIEPYYAAHIGNTGHRDSAGYKGTYYQDYSGRNDIIGAQVAHDDEYLWFLVECAENITPYTDKLWMNLYIDTIHPEDGTVDGWNSFEFVVNKTAPTATEAVLEKFTGDGYASEKVADVAYTVDGRYMTVQIPKSALGLSGETYTVNFAWTDNVHDATDKGEGSGDATVYSTFSGDILDFYTSGDVAPGARFKFSYISTAENAGAESDSLTENETEALSDSETLSDTASLTDSETVSEIDAPSEGCASVMGISIGSVCLCGAAWAWRKKKR